jgi:hypothetical protein
LAELEMKLQLTVEDVEAALEYAGLRGSLGPPHIGGRSVCTMRGNNMHNMFHNLFNRAHTEMP